MFRTILNATARAPETPAEPTSSVSGPSSTAGRVSALHLFKLLAVVVAVSAGVSSGVSAVWRRGALPWAVAPPYRGASERSEVERRPETVAMATTRVRLAQPNARGRAPLAVAPEGSLGPSLGKRVPQTASNEVSSVLPLPSRTTDVHDLAEEAHTVTEARHALVAGDAAGSLQLVYRTRTWSVRALEPEELGLEARALRALGRTDEASVVEASLRRRFPEHALAR